LPPAEPFEPDLSRWDPWNPAEVARRLASVDAPWYVAAGWAIDLFLGRETRPHEDIEIAVPEEKFPAVRRTLADLELFAIGDGLARGVDEQSLAAFFQTWAREPDSGVWRLDVMREPWEDDTWVFRRDPRVRRPSSDVIAHTDDGIPYAQPEIVLLYKAKAARDKDEADFHNVLRRLGREQRVWLRDALELIHPGHHWSDALRV
jgi:Aminoglycoside-2''-adenylyltransferase